MQQFLLQTWRLLWDLISHALSDVLLCELFQSTAHQDATKEKTNSHIKLLIGWTRYQRTYRYITSTSGMKGLQWFCRGCTSHKWLNCTSAPCVFVITEQIFCVQNWFVNTFLTIPFKLGEINPIQANKLLAQPSVCPWLNKQELEHWISLCALHACACVFLCVCVCVCVRACTAKCIYCCHVKNLESSWKRFSFIYFFHRQRPSTGVKERSFSFAGNVTLPPCWT